MTANRRRWLVVTSGFPRHDGDLAGHFVGAWCQSLIERGHGVDVLCWRGPEATDRRIGAGSSVRFIPYGPPSVESLFFGAGAPENLSSNPLRALLAVPAMASMSAAIMAQCHRRDYDGVVGHWLVPGGLIARAIGAVTGLSSYVVGHSGGVHLLDNLPPVAGRPLVRWLTAGPTTVPSTPLRDKLEALADEPLVDGVDVAPMGYEPAPDGIDTEDRLANERLQLGFLGRLVPIKGLPVVLRAVEQLRRGGVDVGLEVVGDGPCRQRWERQAGPGVEFRGALYGRHKWRALRRWDGLVLPSVPQDDGRHEGLPVSLLEAASVGTVPVVSGVPGVQKWLACPERQCLAAGELDAWVEALSWLAEMECSRWERLRDKTRNAVEELEWPRYAEWWERWLMAN